MQPRAVLPASDLLAGRIADQGPDCGFDRPTESTYVGAKSGTALRSLAAVERPELGGGVGGAVFDAGLLGVEAFVEDQDMVMK